MRKGELGVVWGGVGVGCGGGGGGGGGCWGVHCLLQNHREHGEEAAGTYREGLHYMLLAGRGTIRLKRGLTSMRGPGRRTPKLVPFLETPREVPRDASQESLSIKKPLAGLNQTTRVRKIGNILPIGRQTRGRGGTVVINLRENISEKPGTPSGEGGHFEVRTDFRLEKKLPPISGIGHPTGPPVKS